MAKVAKGVRDALALEEAVVRSVNTIDEFYGKTQPIGSLAKANTEALAGINHTKVNTGTLDHRESFGYTFFTRPQLNLTDDNLIHIRKFTNLLTEDPDTIQRYVRMMLDPRLKISTGGKIDSTLINNRLGFIPVLTNNLKSISGWPDMVMPTFASKQGVKKEQWVIGDGMVDIYDTFDLDCSFRNTINEPIITLMQTWLYYMAYVFEGIIAPYPDFIVNNEIDYNTRIYRLVMDPYDRVVTKIAAVGASFPVNVPTGKLFDSSNEKFLNTNMKDLNIRFKCVGAMYNDDILIDEFNKTSVAFNYDLIKVIESGFTEKAGHNYDKIPHNLKERFNHRGYPLINTETLELDWWLDTTGRDRIIWEQILKEVSTAETVNNQNIKK